MYMLEDMIEMGLKKGQKWPTVPNPPGNRRLMMGLEIHDEDIRRAAKIIECEPAALKKVLLQGGDRDTAKRQQIMTEAALVVRRMVSRYRNRRLHQQAHALELAAKAIERASSVVGK